MQITSGVVVHVCLDLCAPDFLALTIELQSLVSPVVHNYFHLPVITLLRSCTPFYHQLHASLLKRVFIYQMLYYNGINLQLAHYLARLPPHRQLTCYTAYIVIEVIYVI